MKNTFCASVVVVFQSVVVDIFTMSYVTGITIEVVILRLHIESKIYIDKTSFLESGEHQKFHNVRAI